MDRIFNFVFKAQEKQLHSFLQLFLWKYYGRDRVVSSNGQFLIAGGDLPVALVSHLDTVHRRSNRNSLYVDEKRGVAWSPDGLGADDRAGVYAIIQLVLAGYRPHIIFTHGEESGGTGATALTKFELPFEVKFMIELDRRGHDEAVFYDCGNKEFQDKILSFGVNKGFGTFSDISILGPSYDVACVNMGIGYYGEHTTSEILKIDEMWDTIEVVSDILTWVFQEWETIPDYDYQEVKYNYSGYGYQNYRTIGTSNVDTYRDSYSYYQGQYSRAEVVKRDSDFFTVPNKSGSVIETKSVADEEEVEGKPVSEMGLDDFDFSTRSTWSQAMYDRYFDLLYGEDEMSHNSKVLAYSGEIVSDRGEVVNEYLRREIYGELQ